MLSETAAMAMAVIPRSASWGRSSARGLMNWGMKAPKKRSVFGLLTETRNPCRRKPPRGGAGAKLTPPFVKISVITDAFRFPSGDGRMRRAVIGLALAIAAASNSARADTLRIALIEDRSPAHAEAARRSEDGFRLGLDYATRGTRRVHGRALALRILDDRGDPAASARLLAEAYRDRSVALAGGAAATLAMLPVAARLRRVLLVAHAEADAITGSAGNRYVFRTAADASQMAIAAALALARPELNLAVLAPDTGDGHGAVEALKAALRRRAQGAFFIAAYFLPLDRAEIGRRVAAQFEALHDLHGAKTLLAIWPGSAPPIAAIAATDPGRFGIRLALCGALDPQAPPPTELDGVTSYFYSLPSNPVNAWLVARWAERFHTRPDGIAAEAMTAAIAAVAALARAPSAESDALVAALEGLRFRGPKGQLVIRPQDHQALQPLYQFRIEAGRSPAAPELVRTIEPAEMRLPLGRSG